MIVQTLGALTALDSGYSTPLSYGSIRMYNQRSYDYATLYRTQPNVRTCVDFLARNIAQLGLHVFRRVSDTDRERLTDHPLAELLSRPLPVAMKVTRYRLIEAMISDMGVYFNAYWLKMEQGGGKKALLRVPPDLVTVKGSLSPLSYEISLGGKRLVVAPEDIVHFRGYNPENPISGLSPLETLRRVLAEEFSMGDYREDFWQNAARMYGIIKRPSSAPEWSTQARERFKSEYEALHSGSGSSGRTAILEDDMEWQEMSFNAQESEYLGGRRLTREECARAYHIPLPMVGILEHATFCLPAHVPVFTEMGPRPIAEVAVGERVWSHDGAGFVLKSVIRSGQIGIDPILRIRTQNRILEANTKHPVLVRRLVRVAGVADPTASSKVRAGQTRWHYETQHVYVTAGEIRRGDILVALKELPEGAPQQSIARMEFYGLLLGDGNVYPKTGSVTIARANDAPYMDHYRGIMRSEFESFGNHGNGKTREDVPTQPVTLVEGDRQTRFASVVAVEELSSLGLCGTAHTKRVPGWVFGATRDERLAFLRGYLDSDGSVDKRGKISYSSCNPDLIEDVRHLCMSLGVPVNNAYHRVGQTILPTGDVGDVDQWAITCSDPAANRMIGSHNPRHQKRLIDGRGWDRKGKEYPFAKGRRSDPPVGCEYSRVVDIETLPAEAVYNLEVEGNHNFIAAGVIVHNSNIKEQHKNLYQDSLGPWLAMIEEDIVLQLLTDYDDSDGVYVEFNIQEKLQGSFEEQAQGFQTAVGRPWMEANEARARMNLPQLAGGDGLALPLNMLIGDPAAGPAGGGADASVGDGDEDAQAGGDEGEPKGRQLPGQKAARVDPTLPELRKRHEEQWARVMAQTFRRQMDATVGKVPADAGGVVLLEELWDRARWDREMHADLFRLNNATATVWGEYVAEQLAFELESERMVGWLDEHSRIQAEYINGVTRDQIGQALIEEEPRSAVRRLFELAIAVRAIQIAVSAVTSASAFGSNEGAQQGGLKTKRWQVNSSNPRDEHLMMNGETVGIGELFSNGMKWPGDPAGGADNNANCQCSVTFGR